MSDDLKSPWPVRAEKAPVSRQFVALVVVAFAVIYTATTARSLQGGDSGELLVLALRGGRAHPPGYPLYTMLAGAFAEIPGLSPIVLVSLFSSVCAIAALVLMYLGLLRWGFGNTASGVATCLLGVSPLFWRYAGVPEVFALNALCFAALLWSAGRFGRPRGAWRAGLIGLLLGLGLTSHQTLVFAAPIALIGWFRAYRETQRRLALSVPALALVGLALGLTPHLTLLGVDPKAAWAWGGHFDLSALVDHVLRREYGTTSLGLLDQDPGLLANTRAYASHLVGGFIIAVPLGIWGMIVAGWASIRLRRLDDDGLDAAALLGVFLLLAILFFAMVNLRPQGLAAHVVERFYVLPDVAFATLCCVGLEHLLRRRPRYERYARAFAVGVVSILIVTHAEAADWSQDYAVEDYIFNALDTADAGSVIVGTGDLQLFGFLAASEVFAYRTDVTYVDLELLRARWYYDRVRRQLPGFTTPYDSERTRVVDIIDNLRRSRRLYVADIGAPVPGIEPSLVPIGPLLEVLPPDKTPPSIQAVERANHAVFSRLQFRGSGPRRPDTWSSLARSYYARSWLSLASSYERVGSTDRAQRMRMLADPFLAAD